VKVLQARAGAEVFGPAEAVAEKSIGSATLVVKPVFFLSTAFLQKDFLNRLCTTSVQPFFSLQDMRET
jgi:hypothetical protein